MSIVFDENKRVFKLDTEKSSYAFHITDSRNLLHLYYGGYIPETDITHMLRIPNDEPFVPAVHDAMGPHSLYKLLLNTEACSVNLAWFKRC